MIFIKRNKLIIITTILLALIGVIMIYSSSYIWASFKYNNPYKYVFNQGIFFIIGIFLSIYVLINDKTTNLKKF